MPIPNLLVGPSLLAVAAAGDPAVDTERYAASAQDALARLGAQRRALLSQQVPRLIALWEGLGATSASETYGNTLALLTGSEGAATAEAIRDEVVVPLSPPANDDGKHALVEIIRLQAVERASSAGLDALARARIRLSEWRDELRREAPTRRPPLLSNASLREARYSRRRRPQLPGNRSWGRMAVSTAGYGSASAPAKLARNSLARSEQHLVEKLVEYHDLIAVHENA